MEYAEFARFVLALASVIGLIWLCAYLAKRFGLDKKLSVARSGAGHLSVVDTLFLDSRRKLVVVKHHSREYVLLLSGDSATCIETREASHEA